VLGAHALRAPAPPRRAPVRRLAAAAAVVALVTAFTPPGQAVGDWLAGVVDSPRQAPAPARPAGAELLVRSPEGLVLVRRGGERRLGAYREAAWSPHGRFVIATTRHELRALDPQGVVRWRVLPPGRPRHAAWSPDGVRIAYLAGGDLRVVVGDGTDDRLFRRGARPVPPAFMPGSRTIAWADRDGHVRVADVDVAQLRWRSARPAPGGIHALSWSADARRLLAAGRRRLALYDLSRGREKILELPSGRELLAAAYPPRGAGAPALLERRGRRTVLRRLGGRALWTLPGRHRTLLWAPDGRRVLAGGWLVSVADGRAQPAPALRRALAWRP
jgi:hypothetical protein